MPDATTIISHLLLGGRAAPIDVTGRHHAGDDFHDRSRGVDGHRLHASRTSAAKEDQCMGRANSFHGLRRAAKRPVFQRQQRRQIFFAPGSSAVTGLTDVVALKGDPTNKNRFSPAKNACFTGLVTGSRTW
jgi:hypothetical protein